MLYVKVTGPNATATTYRAQGPVKMGRAILWESPANLDLEGWRKAIPYGFDRLDTGSIDLDRNEDGEISPNGVTTAEDDNGAAFWQVQWAVFQDDPEDMYPYLGVVTRRSIYLLGENGKTLDRVT